MIQDNQLKYSSDQAITASGATDSTNVIDQLADGDAYGNELFLTVKCKENAIGTLTTTKFQLITSSASIFSSPVTLIDTGTIVKATTIVGYDAISMRVPKGLKRFSKIVYTTDAVATNGKYDAFLSYDVERRS